MNNLTMSANKSSNDTSSIIKGEEKKLTKEETLEAVERLHASTVIYLEKANELYDLFANSELGSIINRTELTITQLKSLKRSIEPNS